MKRLVGLVVFLVFCVSLVHAQYNCQVKVKELQGQYNGECKKGLANGEGVAKGTDSYAGRFKKGYPHGFGVYSWANGSNYIGNFTKGKKDGYGLLNTLKPSGELEQDYGLWLADSLMVPNDPKALFKVKERQGIKLIDPRLSRDKSIKNQIWINFQVNGVPDKSIVMGNATISSGKKIDTKERSLNTLIAFDDVEEFPVTFRLEYQIRKTTHFEMIDCTAEVTLFTPGLWEIDVNH